MASKSVIDQNLLRRELKRFEQRVGMSGLPDFVDGKALVLKISDGAISIELNKDKTQVLVSYNVEPQIAMTDAYVKRSLEASCYQGGEVVTALYSDPKLIFMVTLNNQDISSENIENLVMKLIKMWEEIKHGFD